MTHSGFAWKCPWVASADATFAFTESRVCKRQPPSNEPKTLLHNRNCDEVFAHPHANVHASFQVVHSKLFRKTRTCGIMRGMQEEKQESFSGDWKMDALVPAIIYLMIAPFIFLVIYLGSFLNQDTTIEAVQALGIKLGSIFFIPSIVLFATCLMSQTRVIKIIQRITRIVPWVIILGLLVGIFRSLLV